MCGGKAAAEAFADTYHDTVKASTNKYGGTPAYEDPI